MQNVFLINNAWSSYYRTIQGIWSGKEYHLHMAKSLQKKWKPTDHPADLGGAKKIRQLEKELTHAKLERDIVKKAVRIFSKND